VKVIDVGEIIGGKYALVRLLGTGGMGEVWLARHQALQQAFAVKIMAPPSAEPNAPEGLETSLRRFRNEAQIAAALSRKSRHIASVTDYGVEGGTAYLVMELLEGEPLEARIGDGKKLPPDEVGDIVRQITKALAVAHAEGVTHRDLKPANVFLTRGEDGRTLVKLLDFGIARMAKRIVTPHDASAPTRLTIQGLVLGSPAYMSPEQAMAEPMDHRADVWALAVVAYEALAGATPFAADTVEETIVRICNHRATPLRDVMPEAPDALASLFARAFSERIDDRFQSATELSDALAAALAPPPPAPARARSLAPTLAIGGAIGLVVVAALVLSQTTRPTTPASLPSATHAPTVVVTSATPPAASPSAAPPAIAPTTTAVATTTRPSIARTNATVIAAPTTSATGAPPAKSVDRSAVF
jgi:eukaryotic-like serine/threonine-protein kinase